MMTACFVPVTDGDAGMDLLDLTPGGEYASGDIVVQTLTYAGRADKSYVFMRDRRGNWNWTDVDTSAVIAEGDVSFPAGAGLWVAGVDGATITGYSAVQTWSEDANLQFTNCILNGVNQWGPGTNNYATIVVVQNAGTGSTITCTNCTITATEKDDGVEYLCSLRADCKVVLNDCTFMYMSKDDETFIDVTQAEIKKGSHIDIWSGVNYDVVFNSEENDE